MRHLIISLLCVSTCLAATASKRDVMQQFNPTKILPSSMKVTKANRMNTHYTLRNDSPGPVMSGAKKALQAQKVKPENLVNKRAPHRLSDQEIVDQPYVCFLYAYDIMDDGPVPADPFYAGAGAYWYPDVSDGMYFAGFYWDEEGSTYYLPLDIDYNTGEVALPWGILLRDDSVIGHARTRTDTVWFELIVSQAYWENQEQSDCMGTLYNDGSIIFDDNYVYYTYREERVYQNNVLQRTDITEAATMFVGTEILAANGEHTYTLEQNGQTITTPVFMYQNESADTLYVGNLWDYGVPNSYMILHSDGIATYPCAEYDEENDMTYLYNPIWDVDDSWISGGLGMFYPVSDYTLDDNGYITDFTWGFEGVVTPEKITWEYTMPCNGYHFLYGFENNILKGNFIIPTPEPIFLRGDVNDDGVVDFHDIMALCDFLLNGDFDSINYDNADCDLDGTVDNNDRQPLIDYILNGNWPED